MNQDKKQIVEDIMNTLIKIYVYDFYNAQDKKLVGCTYKHDQIINAVIKHCSSLCLHDWSSDIIKDQTYLSVFESINKIAQRLIFVLFYYKNPIYYNRNAQFKKEVHLHCHIPTYCLRYRL